jgi:transcriptional regulator with XRE-family HTH domain
MEQPDDVLELTPFQNFLLDAYAHYVSRTRRRKTTDTQFSMWLGVSPVTYNAWVNGTRKPDLASALKLSDKLGLEVFDVLGFPRVYAVDDPLLRLIVEEWENLNEETKTAIHEAANNARSGKSGDVA